MGLGASDRLQLRRFDPLCRLIVQVIYGRLSTPDSTPHSFAWDYEGLRLWGEFPESYDSGLGDQSAFHNRYLRLFFVRPQRLWFVMTNSEREASLEKTLSYHEETKHHLERYARSAGYIKWEDQPNPFREFQGAPRVELPFARRALEF